MRIAFQGEPGAYSEAAALACFGPQAEALPCRAFEDVFAAVETAACVYGMLPIENSLAGSVHRNYDLLLGYDLPIVGEFFLHVHHCLIALPGATLAGIRRVISHPQALAQCDRYLRSLPGVTGEAVYDTAGSVRMVRELGDPQVAAIASRHAAGIYGLPILVDGIEDHPANYTRFLAIARQPAECNGPAKTSIVFALPNEPGALFKALSVFALRNINLTKIESRPLAGRPWEYLFYVDFAGAAGTTPNAQALNHLQEMATSFRLLGSYPCGHFAGAPGSG